MCVKLSHNSRRRWRWRQQQPLLQLQLPSSKELCHLLQLLHLHVLETILPLQLLLGLADWVP
jgi:hypothetical protein